LVGVAESGMWCSRSDFLRHITPVFPFCRCMSVFVFGNVTSVLGTLDQACPPVKHHGRDISGFLSRLKTGLSDNSDGWFLRQIDSVACRDSIAVGFLRPSALCCGGKSPSGFFDGTLLLCVDEERCLGIDSLRHIFRIPVLFAFLHGMFAPGLRRGRG
jgi:hypothetical protein